MRAGRARIALIVVATATLGLLPASGVTNADFAPAVNYAIGSHPYSVALGDLNGDEKPDLAVANASSHTVSILLGNGNGTLAPAVNYNTGIDPVSVAAGDLNGDGKPDLAVANLTSNSVSIMLGNGNGTFAPAVGHAFGIRPVAVAIGDVNGDGKADLAVASSSSNNVAILLGNSTGSFGPAANHGVGTYPISLAFGDLNGDGKPDLAVANYSSHTVSILLGNGNGTFGAAVNYSVGTSPYSVALGDVNGDAKPDLAVANYTSSTVSILPGNGNGTFGAPVDNDAHNPTSVAIGDLNGDGRPDVAAASSGLNGGPGATGVSILPGNGNGTFGATVTYSAGVNPFAVALGDANSDGKLDLAVANYGSSTVSILLNASADWPFTFTDETLTPRVTPIKAVHVSELRNAINALRGRHSLLDFSFVDLPLIPGSTVIRATHITQLRTALDAVYDALGRPRPTYTDPMLTAGVTSLKPVHLSEIRNAVRAAGWFVLTATRAGAGSGTVTSSPPGITCATDCTEGYLPATAVMLTATPAAGSTFAGWTGACTGTGPCQVTMAADTSVTAMFNLIGGGSTLTVTKSGPGTGTVTSSPAGIDCGTDCQETYLPGTSVTLTASAAAGSYFANWTGACSDNGPCISNMSTNVDVGATFNVAATHDVHPRDYFMGVSGGCDGGVIGVEFFVTAPAGVTWTVAWTGSDLPPSSHAGAVNRTSGTGSGSVVFTVTVASQTPYAGGCSSYTTYDFSDRFFFNFYDSNGHKITEINTIFARWTYRLLF